MDWTDERYVRVYTRDTMGWMRLGWEAQSLFYMLLRQANRAGLIRDYDGTEGLAMFLRMPEDVVTRAFPKLLADGCLSVHGTTILIRNYVEAQEAKQGDAQRQRDSRERARAVAMCSELGIPSHGVTKEPDNGHADAGDGHADPSNGHSVPSVLAHAVPPEPSVPAVTAPPDAEPPSKIEPATQAPTPPKQPEAWRVPTNATGRAWSCPEMYAVAVLWIELRQKSLTMPSGKERELQAKIAALGGLDKVLRAIRGTCHIDGYGKFVTPDKQNRDLSLEGFLGLSHSGSLKLFNAALGVMDRVEASESPVQQYAPKRNPNDLLGDDFPVFWKEQERP